MHIYTPNAVSDIAVELWFHKLVQLGELKLLFTTPENWRLSYFLPYFSSCTLVYDVDDQGCIIRAAWFNQFDIGAKASLWIHPDHRKESASLDFTIQALENALQIFGVIFGITIQQHLLEPHRHLGYTVLAHVPKSCDGHDAWLLMLTDAGLKGSPLYGKKRLESSR